MSALSGSRSFTALLLLAAVLSCTKEPAPGPAPDPGVSYGSGTVVGSVRSGGEPVSGVVISDGFVTDTTGASGLFSLPSRKEHGYVFMSIPDGYDVPSDGVTPRFFAPVGLHKQDTVSFEVVPDRREEYTFYVLGDMHLANKRGDIRQFADFARDLNGRRREGDFAVTLGDMSWDAYWDGFGLDDYLSRVNLDFSGMEIFHTVGNHDHDLSENGDWATVRAYKNIIGPTYYSFNRGGVHFIVLDDIVCQNSAGKRSSYNRIDETQVAWLKKDLSFVPETMPLAVFLHAPLYRDTGSLNLSSAMDFINCLKGRSKITVFSGHTHCVYNVDHTATPGYVPIFESCSGAVCGAWWYMVYDFPKENVHIGTDGAPGGYRIVRMKGGDLEWVYKATGMPEDYQFRAYDRNAFCLDASLVSTADEAGRQAFLRSVGDYAMKSEENLVYLNVWDWDPGWKIEVMENGRSLDVRRLSGVKDPMYLYSMEAFSFNKGYTAEYTPGVLTASYPASTTCHIFSVEASSPSSTLEIRVEDRFGRVYSETMHRPRELKLEY